MCNICNKIFGNVFKLKTHLRTHAEKVRKHECLICWADYNSYGELQIHTKKVHSKQELKASCICDICDVRFFSKLKMDMHMKLEHNGPFKCFFQKCYKYFMSSSTRKKHFLSFHNSNVHVS